MNEMQLLEEFRAVVAPPDPGTLAQARAGVLADAAVGQASLGARSPRLRGSWPKLALTGLAAAATATAVTVALTAPGGAPSHPGTASLTAKELAYRAAGAAAAQPGVRPGQWIYRQVKVTSAGSVLNGTYQGWDTANSAKETYLTKYKKAIRVPCPRGGCRPKMLLLGMIVNLPVTYASLSSLPHNPGALDHYLAGIPLPGGAPAPFREFDIIATMLMRYVMPPALTAELYQALGDIPGVTVDQHAVDVAGRHGTGFQISAPPAPNHSGHVPNTEQIILNPKTYALMGIQSATNQRRGPGHRHGYSGTAILKTAFVSGPGILP
jgi:hypothetical protein